jgi:hypothetical protein
MADSGKVDVGHLSVAPTGRDQRAIYERLMVNLTGAAVALGLRGTERDLVRTFLEAREAYKDLVPFDAADTVVTEMAFRYGRADIVIFHVDGSASVIEAKDCAKGYSHVVAGIGQAGLYATQLALAKTIPNVRRCLLWGSTGDLRVDAVISAVCDQAGVVRLPWMPASAVSGFDLMFPEVADG